MREPTVPGWAEKQTPTPFLYHKLYLNILIKAKSGEFGRQYDNNMDLLLICNLELNDLTSITTVFISLIVMMKGLCEYDEYVKRNRIQYLLEYGKQYTEKSEIKEVVIFLEQLEDDNMYKKDDLNDNNTYKESALPIHSIEMYMRFIEELELLIRNRAVSESATLNLFGYYTTILDKYNSRWPALNYNSKFWNIYRSFVERAKRFNYNNVSI